jgi:branched-chain amino acid transport system ATP-binding protein
MLKVSGLSAGYGRVPVLSGVSFNVERGEIVVILGANGAGKSTLLRTIVGLLKPYAGRILLGDHDITGASPEETTRRGLRLVLDGHRVFPELSVADNLRLGATIARDRAAVPPQLEKVFGIFPILYEKRRAFARDLSGGQQQMLALAQAFVAQPDVLLCDEPSLGLAQGLIPPILNFLRGWAQQGVAIVIVEQQIDIALSVANRGIVMDRGCIRLEGSASDLRQDERVRDIYLGTHEEGKRQSYSY